VEKIFLPIREPKHKNEIDKSAVERI